MPSYLEATVIRPSSPYGSDEERQTGYDAMRRDLSRWSIGDIWWGERGIEGPAGLLTIESGTDALPALFAITEMGYVITHVHLKYRNPT